MSNAGKPTPTPGLFAAAERIREQYPDISDDELHERLIEMASERPDLVEEVMRAAAEDAINEMIEEGLLDRPKPH
jgi:hypothetical protein